MNTEKDFELSRILLRLLSLEINTFEEIPSTINNPELSARINRAIQHNPLVHDDTSATLIYKKLQERLNILNIRG